MTGHLDQRAEIRLQTGVHLARYMSQDPQEFWKAVRDIEDDPLFLSLWQSRPTGGGRPIRIVPRRGSYGSDVPEGRAGTGLDVEHLLEGFESLVAQLQALGREAFTALFLKDSRLTLAEIAEVTGLDVADLKQFRDQVLAQVEVAQVMEEEQTLPGPSPASVAIPLEPVARLEARGGHLHVESFTDRVRYQVDDAAVQRLLASGTIPQADVARWSELRRKLYYVNLRYNLIHRIVTIAAAAQEPFLLTGREADRAVLEMKRVASELGVHPSWVSRLIGGKSLLGPAGELPLRRLFLETREDNKARGKRLILKLLAERGPRTRDAEIQKVLQAAGIKVSRRTVNSWRQEVRRAAPDRGQVANAGEPWRG